MSREEKLKFIEEKHPELYQLLQANVPNVIDDIWNIGIDDIDAYNSWVSFYCGRNFDVDLMKMLLI